MYDEPGQNRQSSLAEKVKKAKSFSQSVMSPQNRNSRGQMMFLRRRDNAHRWTTAGGPDVDSSQQLDRHPSAAAAGAAAAQKPNPNAWSPRQISTLPGAVRPPPLPSSTYPSSPQMQRSGWLESPVLERRASPSSPSSTHSLTDDLQQLNDRGSNMFARRKEKSEKWVVAESKDFDGRDERGPTPGDVGNGPEGAPSHDAAAGANRTSDMVKSKKPTLTSWSPTVTRSDFMKRFDNVNQTTPSNVSSTGVQPTEENSPAGFSAHSTHFNSGTYLWDMLQ